MLILNTLNTVQEKNKEIQPAQKELITFRFDIHFLRQSNNNNHDTVAITVNYEREKCSFYRTSSI